MGPSSVERNEWRVDFTRRAEKDLRRLDRPVAHRILAAVAELGDSHRSTASMRLKGRDEWRLRVGDWRVIFARDAEEQVLMVLRILPRGRAYDR